MLKKHFKKDNFKKDTFKKKYAKPELYPLGRATFLTHGYMSSGCETEKDSNGEESLYNSNG